MSRTVHALSFTRGSELVADAVAHAAELHDGDERGDGTPFALHPLEVAALLHAVGCDDETVAAGALHDVIEKTEATRDDLAERFGPLVADTVAALSEDASIPDRDSRKADLRARIERSGERAALVTAADKVSKLVELRVRARSGQLEIEEDHLPTKLRHYRASFEIAERSLGDHPLVRMLRFQLETLDETLG